MDKFSTLETFIIQETNQTGAILMTLNPGTVVYPQLSAGELRCCEFAVHLDQARDGAGRLPGRLASLRHHLTAAADLAGQVLRRSRAARRGIVFNPSTSWRRQDAR
jgi:hypothetical protein